MIISASRRTDIPAFYGEWMARRLRAGECTVVNPFNPRQVSRVSLATGDVDAIVFWTKNPKPFFPYLDELNSLGYRYYFLFTLNDYPPDLEPFVPPLQERVETFRELGRLLGPGRVVWRYDPIVLTERLTADDHRRAFERIASQLRGCCRLVIVSFLDLYRKTQRRLAAIEGAIGRLVADPFAHPETGPLVRFLADTAAQCGMEIQSCAEHAVLAALGIRPGKCIDGELIRREFGCVIRGGKDPGQRDVCLCDRARDIGAVNTCLHGCAYCYSTASNELAGRRHAAHDPCGEALVPAPAREPEP